MAASSSEFGVASELPHRGFLQLEEGDSGSWLHNVLSGERVKLGFESKLTLQYTESGFGYLDVQGQAPIWCHELLHLVCFAVGDDIEVRNKDDGTSRLLHSGDFVIKPFYISMDDMPGRRHLKIYEVSCFAVGCRAPLS